MERFLVRNDDCGGGLIFVGPETNLLVRLSVDPCRLGHPPSWYETLIISLADGDEPFSVNQG